MNISNKDIAILFCICFCIIFFTICTVPNNKEVQLNTNYNDINTSIYTLFDYPNIKDHNDVSILSEVKFDKLDSMNQYLNNKNSLIDSSKQLKIWILIFKNKSEFYAKKQELYWNNGNKNEIVLILNVDNNSKIVWSNAFGWSLSDKLKYDLMNLIYNKSLYDIKSIIDNTVNISIKEYNTKSFVDFNCLNLKFNPISIIMNITILLLFIIIMLYIQSHKK